MALFGAQRPAVRPLRLIAQEAEDLPAMAALVQDAALRVGDMVFEASGRHFTLRMNRFCHESESVTPLRAPCVLRINCVLSVKTRGLAMKETGAPLSLLDISAEPLVAPGFALTLRFAGEGERDIRLETECLDVLLLDLAAPRRAKSLPKHD